MSGSHPIMIIAAEGWGWWSSHGPGLLLSLFMAAGVWMFGLVGTVAVIVPVVAVGTRSPCQVTPAAH